MRMSQQVGQITGLREQFADPLARNGYSLIANTAVTGALGLVYWLLMARRYPAADVGRASALFVVMNLLAGLTALNFNGALNRFIPQAGRQTRALIVRAYAVSVVTSAVVTTVFLLTTGWWGRSYSELRGVVPGLVFTGCVVVWAVFTLQDSVLVGLRGGFWVLAENGIFGVVKIGLLALLVTVLPGPIGIYASWMLPVIVAVPLVNLLIFGKLVPRHVELTGDRQLSNRQIGRFLAGDYSGALFLLAGGSLVPIVVAAHADAQATAYFNVAWLISLTVNTIGINMAMSLTVEGAFDVTTLAAQSRRALRKVSLVLLPCIGVVCLVAPWGLRLFGPAYAAHGTLVLELLAVTALPCALIEAYLGALRAQSRTSLVALIQASRGVLQLGLAVALTTAAGTTGAALATLGSQAVVAAAVAPGLWRVMRADQTAGSAVPDA
jgi:O-antigen/teichoic acid export membrane protein